MKREERTVSSVSTPLQTFRFCEAGALKDANRGMTFIVSPAGTSLDLRFDRLQRQLVRPVHFRVARTARYPLARLDNRFDSDRTPHDGLLFFFGLLNHRGGLSGLMEKLAASVRTLWSVVLVSRLFAGASLAPAATSGTAHRSKTLSA